MKNNDNEFLKTNSKIHILYYGLRIVYYIIIFYILKCKIQIKKYIFLIIYFKI